MLVSGQTKLKLGTLNVFNDDDKRWSFTLRDTIVLIIVSHPSPSPLDPKR